MFLFVAAMVSCVFPCVAAESHICPYVSLKVPRGVASLQREVQISVFLFVFLLAATMFSLVFPCVFAESFIFSYVSLDVLRGVAFLQREVAF